ncbi:hypothetical protein [Rhizobium sp. BE258]|uniref:hypothetical protein n=1 Tax=Rhizobium sp. BE258 TaxID=2817722 RepID=UPI0013AF3F91|nr:hypothetical protein [Rhizobium sp. BE258]MDR7145016.1 hypothetical protein [Rhizobium sp. BE258]
MSAQPKDTQAQSPIIPLLGTSELEALNGRMNDHETCDENAGQCPFTFVAAKLGGAFEG